MTYKSLLLAGITATATLLGASLTAVADDYDNGGTPRYDSQAGQTRALNTESLRRAREDSYRLSRPDDRNADDNDNDDDRAVVEPEGDPDAHNDADDNDDAPLPDERRKTHGS